MTKNRSTKLKIGKHVRLAPSGHEAIIREYARAIATLGRVKADAQKQGGHDDLPGVEIASPAVKPKGVKPQQIRKAVRKAVQEYSERHSKTLART